MKKHLENLSSTEQPEQEKYIGTDGVQLTPSPNGEKCQANGSNPEIEIQCDECSYYLVCFPNDDLLVL